VIDSRVPSTGSRAMVRGAANMIVVAGTSRPPLFSEAVSEANDF
jgi:hypothetical protein